MDVSRNLIQTALVSVVIFLCYVFLLYTYDRADILRKEGLLAAKLSEGSSLNKLINGSDIDNIPGIRIRTTNLEVMRTNRCADGPVYVGTTFSTDECKRTCDNSSANVLEVKEGEVVAFGTRVLSPGAYCTIGPRPDCDTHNTVVLMTLNSVTCRSKFPNIIGGKLGTEVIACNNVRIKDPRNHLWDYKNNEKFDANQHTLLDEDELLENGEYRYRCRFEGVDDQQNHYEQHPLSRFHPIVNYCASEVFRAALDVRTIYDVRDGTLISHECHCGVKSRLVHVNPNDKGSLCMSVSRGNLPVEKKHKKKRTYVLPYRCFNLYSPMTHVGDRFPCPKEQFLRHSSGTDSVTVEYTHDFSEPIEHPRYERFAGTVGVTQGHLKYG